MRFSSVNYNCLRSLITVISVVCNLTFVSLTLTYLVHYISCIVNMYSTGKILCKMLHHINRRSLTTMAISNCVTHRSEAISGCVHDRCCRGLERKDKRTNPTIRDDKAYSFGTDLITETGKRACFCNRQHAAGSDNADKCSCSDGVRHWSRTGNGLTTVVDVVPELFSLNSSAVISIRELSWNSIECMVTL
jgi:hypothetical protein